MVYKGYLVVERFCESCNVLYGLVVFYGFHLDLVGIRHHRRHSDCPASVPSTVGVEPMMVWVVWKWQEPRLTQAWIVHSLFHCLVPNLFVPLHWRKWASFPIIVIARGCAVFFGGARRPCDCELPIPSSAMDTTFFHPRLSNIFC